MNEMLIAGGLILAGFALRTFAGVWLGRIGNLVIVYGSYRVGAVLFQSVGIGLALAALWLVIPAARVLWTAHRYEIPLERRFRQRNPPGQDVFPDLDDLTREFDEQGFRKVDDVGWQSDNWEQFSRLLVNAETRMQGCIHFHRQYTEALVYVSLVTRTEDGHQWTTWNYPYNLALKIPPEMKLNCDPSVESLAGLIGSHTAFLENNAVTSRILPPDADRLVEMTEEELRRQIDHNLDAGLLRLSGGGRFTYSWRGVLFVLRKFMIDFLRYS